MKEIKLLAPVSIDGYISRINGDTDWIHFEGDDFCKYYNLEFFFDTIDRVVMNRMQYMTLQFQSFTWPIRDKPYYISGRQGRACNASLQHGSRIMRNCRLPTFRSTGMAKYHVRLTHCLTGS